MPPIFLLYRKNRIFPIQQNRSTEKLQSNFSQANKDGACK